MGGRGSGSGAWKSQLRQMAKEGRMPTWVAGTKEQQSAFFKEIDKLYDMPQVSTRQIIDQGDRVYVDYGNRTSGMGYPSGANASRAEKMGVLKMLLWRNK